jgi:hypothetical protein
VLLHCALVGPAAQRGARSGRAELYGRGAERARDALSLSSYWRNCSFASPVPVSPSREAKAVQPLVLLTCLWRRAG